MQKTQIYEAREDTIDSIVTQGMTGVTATHPIVEGGWEWEDCCKERAEGGVR